MKKTEQDEKNIKAIVEAFYRQPQATWAGGNSEIKVNFTSNTEEISKKTRSESYTEWSKNGKWSGKSAKFTIYCQKNWGKNVLKRDLATAGCMLTLYAKKIKTEENITVYKAIWLEQKRSFEVLAKSGYIAKNNNCEYHANSTKKAIAGLKRKEKKEQTAKEKAAKEKAEKEKAEKEFQAKCEKYANLVCTYEDSIKVGNCHGGTINFINRYFNGKKTVTIKELSNLRDKHNSIKRIIEMVIAKQ
jgi:hypothetical protein